MILLLRTGLNSITNIFLNTGKLFIIVSLEISSFFLYSLNSHHAVMSTNWQLLKARLNFLSNSVYKKTTSQRSFIGDLITSMSVSVNEKLWHQQSTMKFKSTCFGIELTSISINTYFHEDVFDGSNIKLEIRKGE